MCTSGERSLTQLQKNETVRDIKTYCISRIKKEVVLYCEDWNNPFEVILFLRRTVKIILPHEFCTHVVVYDKGNVGPMWCIRSSCIINFSNVIGDGYRKGNQGRVSEELYLLDTWRHVAYTITLTARPKSFVTRN